VIIKGIRLRSSSSISRTILHLKNGAENDAVAFVHGTPADIRDMHRDAVSIGSKYAVRHWIIAPHQITNRQQMTEVVATLAKEFAFGPDRAVIVEHQKRRATTDAADIHWHVLVGEVDPATGRILATSFDRVKHEFVARISEFSLGHAFVAGKHGETVVKGLRKKGLHCIADRLEEFSSSRGAATEAFTHSKHQQIKRLGLDLPALKQIIKRSVESAHCREDIATALAAVGLDAKAGDKPGTWIVVDAKNGVLLGALHRLTGQRKSAINDLMTRTAPPEPREEQSAVEALPPRSKLPPVDRQPAVPEIDAIASDMVDQLAERVAVLENSALRELQRTIPDFEATLPMRAAREAARHAADSLSRVVVRRSDLHRQIANMPPSRWWARFTGTAGRRRQKISELEVALDEIETEVRRKEMAITICRRREFREEKAAKEIHAATVVDIAQRQKKAREILAVLEQARIILEEKPEFVAKGLDFVISTARTMLRRSNEIADNLLDRDTARNINR